MPAWLTVGARAFPNPAVPADAAKTMQPAGDDPPGLRKT